MGTSYPFRWDVRRVVSVDGEGQDRDCILSGDIVTDAFTLRRHSLTLLAAADDRGFRAYREHDGSQRWGTGKAPFGPDDVAPNYGLPTIQSFEFLLSLPKHAADLIISFSFTYDVTKIIQDLPLKNLLELAKVNRTRWFGYEIEYLPRKYLTVRKMGREVTVNDVFSFWQSSFIKALEDSAVLFDAGQRRVIDCRFTESKPGKWIVNHSAEHICPGTDTPCIAYMKDHRNEFDHMNDDGIRKYCFSECEFLSIMMRDFLYQMSIIGLPVTKYSISGPGGIAAAYFAKIHLKDYMPRMDDMFAAPGLPIWVPLASYYGGRFEISAIGNVGDVISNDYHSAYPSIAVNLPCLRCGHFQRVSDLIPDKPGFYLVGSRTHGNRWAPFPFRSDSDNRWVPKLSAGSIAFVHGGRRWVTAAEVQTARKHLGNDAIPIYDGYVYETPCKHKPFADLERLYLVRKEGNPSPGLSMIMKLIINSVYGKLAQTIGVGAYRCHIWAALITGGTRAKIMDLLYQAPDSIVAVATDGILTTERIQFCGRHHESGAEQMECPNCPVTDHDLGSLDTEDKADCWLGMPGIYGFGRDDTAMKLFKRRGLDRKYFPLSHLRDTWDRGEWLTLPTEPVRGFMPFRLAVQRKNSLDVMGQWPNMPKVMRFTSNLHKRNLAESDYELLTWGNHGGKTMRLEPITVADESVSAPYRITARVIETPELDEPIFDETDLPPDDGLALGDAGRGNDWGLDL